MDGAKRAELRAAYLGRRDAVFPKKANGRLTKGGEEEALSWLAGVCLGMRLAGWPEESLPTGLVWLASIRGVDDALGITEGQYA